MAKSQKEEIQIINREYMVSKMTELLLIAMIQYKDRDMKLSSLYRCLSHQKCKSGPYLQRAKRSWLQEKLI